MRNVLFLCFAALAATNCSKAPAPAETAAKPEGEASAAKAAPSTPPAADVEGELPDDFPPIVRTPWKGDLDEIAKRRVLRVLLPFRTPDFFFDDTKPAGILWEAFQEVERLLNVKYKTTDATRIVAVLIPTPIDSLQQRMVDGYGDVLAYSASITSERLKLADFTTPTMKNLKIVVVTGPGAPEIATLDDLSGKEVWVHPSSRMKDDLEKFNSTLKAKEKAPAIARDTDSVLQPGDLMEMANAGTYPVVLMQSAQAEYWAQVLPDVKVRMDLAVAEDVELGWAIQKGTPKLKAFLNEFLRTHGIGTSFGNTVIRRYLKNATYARNALEPNELAKFRRLVPMFQKYSNEYDLDALMLIAQGYQESRLDQTAKSHVGAVGLMQVMPTTAAGSPVNISNIEREENNIHAGSRLMSFLIKDYFDEADIDRRDRMLFALAAYNAGPARIRRCRKLAADMGYNPNVWFNNVEVAVAKVVGRETTQYVANIYKYYLGYQLAVEMRQAREDAMKRAGGAKR